MEIRGKYAEYSGWHSDSQVMYFVIIPNTW